MRVTGSGWPRPAPMRCRPSVSSTRLRRARDSTRPERTCAVGFPSWPASPTRTSTSPGEAGRPPPIHPRSSITPRRASARSVSSAADLGREDDRERPPVSGYRRAALAVACVALHRERILGKADDRPALLTAGRSVAGWVLQLDEVVFVRAEVDIDLGRKIIATPPTVTPIAAVALDRVVTAEREAPMVARTAVSGIGEQDVRGLVVAYPLPTAFGSHEPAGLSTEATRRADDLAGGLSGGHPRSLLTRVLTRGCGASALWDAGRDRPGRRGTRCRAGGRDA